MPPNPFNQSDYEDATRDKFMTPPSRAKTTTTATPPPPASQVSKNKIAFASIGDQEKGQRVTLYGTGGVGKTTLSCMIPGKTVFIDLEDSLPILKKQLKAIGATIPQTVQAESFGAIRVALQSDGWDGVDNIVIDSVTKLEELAVKQTLKTTWKEGGKSATGIEDYGYGKGYTHVYETFLPILGDLDRHIRAGRNVILIAHECVNNVPNPSGDDWIRYEPRLQSPSSGKASIRYRIKEWSDHVLFLSYDVNAEKGKATGHGTRTLYSAETPAFMAKSRTTSDSFSIEAGSNPWADILK